MSQSTSSMQLLDIKNAIEAIYQKSRLIHVTINGKRRKKQVEEAPSKIIGIYDRFLCVESTVNHYVEKFTISYIDLMTNTIIIKELQE